MQVYFYFTTGGKHYSVDMRSEIVCAMYRRAGAWGSSHMVERRIKNGTKLHQKLMVVARKIAARKAAEAAALAA